MKKDANIKENMRYPNVYILDDGGNTMWIRDIHIQGISGISNLELKFQQGLNVICGVNGVGKTTVLNSINNFFADRGYLVKNVLCDSGDVQICGFVDEDKFELHEKVTNSELDGRPRGFQSFEQERMKYVLNFGSDRDIKYQRLDSLKSDPQRYYNKFYVSEVDIKNWFVNRYAFSDKPDSVSSAQRKNFDTAKEHFSVLDEKIKFKTVNCSTYDIWVETPRGNIRFEFLSSGYKSCIFIILGLIKEIEYRLSEEEMVVKDFAGVLLIDEIDIHLHPTWQAKLLTALKIIFPKCQIIATTHSPSILQTLEKDEIIALDLDENGNVYQKELQLGKYGLKGWTLEEILTDVMGMPSTNSEELTTTIKAFDDALEEENPEEIKRNFDKLDEMLHPQSTLRKLLQIQMAGMEV